MTQDDGAEGSALDLEGAPLEEAVEAVVAADESRDPTVVRDALSYIAEDDVVTGTTLADTATVVTQEVSAARDRALTAQLELTQAQEAAEPVADLPAVAERLGTYERAVETLMERVEDLEAREAELGERVEDPDSLYAVAEETRAILDEADSIEGTALLLTEELQDLTGDLEHPEAWINTLQRDLNAVEETVDAIASVVDALPAAGDGEDDDADGAGVDWEARSVDPPVAWFDATLRVELVALMVADLRAELDDLRTWARRDEDVDEWYAEAVADRLDEVATRQADLADRLEALARPAWSDRFADRREAFAADLGDLEPPVDWTEMQSVLETYRPADASP